MEEQKPFLVPATLQRVRCFLNTEAGMKVRPWAGADEVLDSFHDALRSHRREDPFWVALERLLSALAEDARRRGAVPTVASAGVEVLDPGRRAGLLAEIRGALQARRRGAGRFRRLAHALSAPAVGLLLLLGGAATAGCYGSHGEEGDVAAEGDDGSARDDGGSPDDAASADEATSEDATEAADEAPGDACVPGLRTFEEIVNTCVTDETYRAEILACVAALHDSWRTGLAALTDCEECWQVNNDLSACLMGGFVRPCDDPADAGTFDEEAFLDNCAIPLYLGVRFE
jgi:hypothetical protein